MMFQKMTSLSASLLLLLLLCLGWSATSAAHPVSNLSLSCSDSHGMNGPCGHAFTEMTPANIAASYVEEWYGNWTRSVRNEPDFKKYGEVTYFGMQFLEDDDYRCGLGFPGCNRWPKWLEILAMHRDDPELARRVHFAVIKHHNVNLILKTLEVC
jgi:hypothetical protein